MDSRARTLIESKTFSAQLRKIELVERMEAAYWGLTWAISTNPEIYPIVPEFQRLRLAKTGHYKWDGGVIPGLKVWFTIEDEDTVTLQAIEVYYPEEE